MIPVNAEWLNWLDDFGNIRSDAPIRVQEAYKDWEKKQEELTE